MPTQQPFPNSSRNIQVETTLNRLKTVGGAAEHVQKEINIANGLSTLGLSESVQLLQLQLIEFSKESRAALERAINTLVASNKTLAESNERSARRMVWLTAGLVFVGLAQVVLSLILSFRA